MSDLAEQILSAAQVMETVAQSKLDIRHLYAPERVEELEGVLRRCAADREIVELHHSGGIYHSRQYCNECGSGEPYEYPVDWPCRTLLAVARGYGIQP